MTATADGSPRGIALVAGLGLLVMALLAPFAVFGVLDWSPSGSGVTW